MRYTNPRLLYFTLGSGATDVVTIEAYTNRDRRDRALWSVELRHC